MNWFIHKRLKQNKLQSPFQLPLLKEETDSSLISHMEKDIIFNGDCLTFLKSVPDGSVDLVVSSPPYNIGKEYEKRCDLSEYISLQTKVLNECHRVLKNSGSLFWQVGSYSINGQLVPLDTKLFPIFESMKMLALNRIVWVRPHGLHASKKFSGRYETISWFSKSDKYKFSLEDIRVPQKYKNKKYHKGDKRGQLSCNPNGKNPGDIWLFQNVKHNHEEQTIHPCQFPEDLISRIVLSTTEKGDTVLDPYMGAGTVAVVSKSFDRFYLGAEVDDTYFEVSQRRLSGLPNKDGSFANLKCLRNHIKKQGSIDPRFRFDVQTSKNPTTSDQSRRFDETHHQKEFEDRLNIEESDFSERLLSNKKSELVKHSEIDSL